MFVAKTRKPTTEYQQAEERKNHHVVPMKSICIGANDSLALVLSVHSFQQKRYYKINEKRTKEKLNKIEKRTEIEMKEKNQHRMQNKLISNVEKYAHVIMEMVNCKSN